MIDDIRCTVMDFERVARVIGDPLIWPSISDDDHTVFDPAAVKNILDDTRLYVLMPNENTVLTFIPQSTILYDSHIAIRLGHRGKEGFAGTRQALGWIFDHTPCLKIVGRFPVTKRELLWMARAMKFHLEGFCRKSILRNGQLEDQIMIGLTKEDWLKA